MSAHTAAWGRGVVQGRVGEGRKEGGGGEAGKRGEVRGGMGKGGGAQGSLLCIDETTRHGM